jgi:hypothetical protein
LVLVSASAQAGATGGLTLAASDQPAAAQQLSALEPNAAEAPQSVARPSLRQRDSQRPQQSQRLQQSQAPQQGQGMQQGQRMRQPGPVTAAKYAVAVKVGQLKRQGASTLARMRYALHRHGIYW